MSSPSVGKVKLKLGKRTATTANIVQINNNNTVDSNEPTITRQQDLDSVVPLRDNIQVEQEPHHNDDIIDITGDSTNIDIQSINIQQSKQQPQDNKRPTIQLKQAITTTESDTDSTSAKNKRYNSVLDYIIKLGHDTLNNLYTDLFTCLTIFRSLPPLAKQYIIRMLCMNNVSISINTIESWINNNQQTKQAHRLAMYRLKELCIVIESTTVKQEHNNNVVKTDSNKLSNTKQYILNTNFQKSIQQSLFSHIIDPTIDQSITTNTKPISIEQLNLYANNKFESILYYMIGIENKSNEPISKNIKQKLVAMNLMQRSIEDKTQYVITNIGFNYLFKDQTTQIWDLILNYIDCIDDSADSNNNTNVNKYDILQFLFRLTFLRSGDKYNIESLTHTQQALIYDLNEFGLIYITQNNKYYTPTYLAMLLSNTQNISSSTSNLLLGSSSSQQNQGFIIVETTFKIYAFTQSLFHTKLLSLFVRLDYRLPSMIVGTITKQSIRNALKNNITSNEIINYLDGYAHSIMRQEYPILPPTVVDQIKLWEHERDRLHRVEAILIDHFDVHNNDYTNILGELKRINPSSILLTNDRSKILVVNEQGMNIVRAYRQRQRQKQLEQQQQSGSTATQQPDNT